MQAQLIDFTLIVFTSRILTEYFWHQVLQEFVIDTTSQIHQQRAKYI